MLKYFLHILKIFEILNFKNKILLVLFFLNSILAAILEIFSIGILALYVGFLSNTKMIIEKIPFNFLKTYLIELDKTTLIFEVSIVVITAFIIKNFIVVFSNWFSLKIRQSIISDNSDEIFSYILASDFKYLIDTAKSAFTYKIYNEVKRVAKFITAYNMLIKDFLLIISISTTLYFINKSIFTIVILIFFSIFLILINTLKGFVRTSADRENKHSSLMLKSISEVIDNVILIKLSSKKKFFIKKYLNQLNLQIKFSNINRIIQSLPKNIFEVVGVAIVICFVLIEIFYGNKNTDEMLPIISFLALVAARMTPSFGAINSNFSTIIYNEKTFIEFFDNRKKMLLNKTQDIDNRENKILKNTDKLEIRLDNVSFSYELEKLVLQNLNYNFEKNYIYGISGKSGSGKSTLTKLIMGLLEPSKGKIYFNGSVLSSKKNNFQNLIGYVPQNIFLINDTIESNIAMGESKNEINSIDIKKSLELVKLSDLLDVPNIEKHKITEQGANLSGGQAQMIGVARAIYRNPGILIFDEPTNNLDINTKNKFIENLKKISSGRICIIVSHDEELLKNCDKIITIDDKNLRNND